MINHRLLWSFYRCPTRLKPNLSYYVHFTDDILDPQLMDYHDSDLVPSKITRVKLYMTKDDKPLNQIDV